MGYTHYWKQDNWGQEDKKGFKKAIPHIKKIAEEHKLGEIFSDLEISSKKIAFTPYESFWIFNRCDSDFCKTNRNAGDEACCKILLILDHFCPNFSFSSDGLKMGEYDDGGYPLPFDDREYAWIKAIDWFIEWEQDQVMEDEVS
jgi:hypothetical protein